VIGIVVLVLLILLVIGNYSVLAGRRRLDRVDWWLNLIALTSAAACLVLQLP
jgi:hypothetical protein